MNTELLDILDKAVDMLHAEYKTLKQARGHAFVSGDSVECERLDSLLSSVKSTYWQIESFQAEVAPDLYLES